MKVVLKRLALHRRELRAWAMYDWANSAFVTVIVTALFPVFYSDFANADVSANQVTARYGLTNALAVAAIALLAPILGTLADLRPIKKKLLSSFAGIGIVATASMALIEQGQWVFASTLFVIAFVGASGSFVFYDALLPHVAREHETHRVSTAGYALGYLGGGLLLLGILLALKNTTLMESFGPIAITKAAFVATAGWWLLFSIPLLISVREPATRGRATSPFALLRESVQRLRQTTRELSRYRHALLFMVAFLIYNDGIGTIIKMAVIFGKEQMQLATGELLMAVLLVQFVGVPFAFAFGQLTRFISAKTAIYLGLFVYCCVAVLGYFMTTAEHFFALALLIGMVQGGVQALSRSVFAAMIPKEKSGEFFGVFAVFERFAGVMGPLLFAGVVAVADSSRLAILAVLAFFVVGGAVLTRVDIEAAKRSATNE